MTYEKIQWWDRLVPPKAKKTLYRSLGGRGGDTHLTYGVLTSHVFLQGTIVAAKRDFTVYPRFCLKRCGLTDASKDNDRCYFNGQHLNSHSLLSESSRYEKFVKMLWGGELSNWA